MFYVGRSCEVINKMNCRYGEAGVIRGYKNIFRETAIEVEFEDGTTVLMYPREIKFTTNNDDLERELQHRCEDCIHDENCTKRVYDTDDKPHFIRWCSRWEGR